MRILTLIKPAILMYGLFLTQPYKCVDSSNTILISKLSKKSTTKSMDAS